MGIASMSGLGFSGWDPIATNRLQKVEEEAAYTAFARNQLQRSTQYQTAVADLQAAGLNPMLAAFHGGTPAVAAPKANIQSVGGGANAQFQTAAMVANMNADTIKKEAEAGEIRARTPTHEVNIDRMKQEISESIERVHKIRQEVNTSAASAAQMEQQVRNLQEQIPQIRASTAQLRALTELNQAQAIERLTASGLNEAHAREILQRVKRDLPHLEEQIRKLEVVAQQLAQPGRMADEAAKSSFVGTLGAYLRALLPLESIIGAIPIGRSGTRQQKPEPLKFPRETHR